MSYPVYIPLYFGSTGPPGPGDKVAILLIIGCIFGAIHNLYTPKFQMKVSQNDSQSAAVYVRAKKYPHVTKIINQNTACLKTKGYYIIEMLDTGIYSNWHEITNLSAQKSIGVSKEKLIADCKECDTHTEIIYKYDNEFGNEVQKKKKLYWHKCYVDELK